MTSIPYYSYNSTSKEWLPAEDLSPIPRKKFTILNFNVLFDEWWGKPYKPHVVRPKERYASQFEHFKTLSPDIIVLNEVTANYVQLIRSEKWAQDYYFSDIDGATIHHFGNLILSKYPFAALHLVELPKLLRPIVTARFAFEHKPLLIAGSHLSAQITNHERRQLQIKTLCSILEKEAPDCDKLILGDINYHQEKEVVPQDYIDCWKKLYPKQAGFTFDGTVNTMLHEMWPLAWMYGFKDDVQMRLDRVFLKASSWKPSKMEICLNKPVYEAQRRSNLLKDFINVIGDKFGRNLARTPRYYLFPSDHFGLFSSFELKE